MPAHRRRDDRPRRRALVAGVAEGFGASLGAALGRAGYDVIGLARSRKAETMLSESLAANGGSYRHLICDLADPGAVDATLRPLLDQPIDAAIYNAHRLLIAPFAQTSVADFENIWRTNCLGAMAVAQLLLPAMAARGHGTMIFTGATAALRGGEKFAAFASAKFALRGLAQSLAREYGPQGVHVAHIVLDGLIWEPQTQQRFAPKREACLDPDAMAQVYLDIVGQNPAAWTHELDLRPHSERF